MSKARWLAGPLVMLVSMVGPAAAAETQVRFHVPEPFRVGSRAFDAGVIALRSISSFTPSTSILEVWVGSQCLGMMIAHRSDSEATALQTEALFHRDDNGLLDMVGFSVSGGPTGTTYRFP